VNDLKLAAFVICLYDAIIFIRSFSTLQEELQVVRLSSAVILGSGQQ